MEIFSHEVGFGRYQFIPFSSSEVRTIFNKRSQGILFSLVLALHLR